MNIAKLDSTLAQLCERQFTQIGWAKPEGYFRQCLMQQETGEIVGFVAFLPQAAGSEGARAAQYVGHIKLLWSPDHDDFRVKGIPEIQDLNVLPDYRNQGVGTNLIKHCEAVALTRSTEIGIGVGLHPGYNNAQRLYPRLGYLIDGRGVHYDNKPVEMGEHYRFDDELVLFFTKQLGTSDS